MAYQLKPDATDQLSVSQADIKNNFIAANTIFGVNHSDFLAGTGKHTFIQMPEHAAPTTAVNEAGFYANVGATSAVTELYFRRENNGASVPMTESSIAANGWSFLPSGLMIQWMLVTVVNQSTAVTFPRAFPNTCFNVQVTPQVSGSPTAIWVSVSTFTTTTCIVQTRLANQNPGLNVPVYLFAIGA